MRGSLLLISSCYNLLMEFFLHNIFQTLGDAKKREQYDRFGYTAAREQQKPSHGFHSPFGDGFFREFNFNFNGFNQGESYIQKFDINLR